MALRCQRDLTINVNEIAQDNIFTEHLSTTAYSFTPSINPFQLSVGLYIETSHLYYSGKETTGLYMKCNTGLKLIK